MTMDIELEDVAAKVPTSLRFRLRGAVKAASAEPSASSSAPTHASSSGGGFVARKASGRAEGKHDRMAQHWQADSVPRRTSASASFQEKVMAETVCAHWAFKCQVQL